MLDGIGRLTLFATLLWTAALTGAMMLGVARATGPLNSAVCDPLARSIRSMYQFQGTIMGINAAMAGDRVGSMM